MARKALKERTITVPQVKEALEAIGEEGLDQFQRRSLDCLMRYLDCQSLNNKIVLEK